MGNIFYDILLRFGRDLGVEAKMLELYGIISAAMLLLALASCFFGFKVFRVWCGLLAFMLTAIAINQLLKHAVGLRVIIVTFSIIGLLVGVLAYHWFRAGAFFLIATLGYGFMQNLTGHRGLCLLVALFLAALTIPYYGHIIIFATSIWGAMALVTGGAEQLGITIVLPLQIAAIVALSTLGIFVQYKTNKHEALYEETWFTVRVKRAFAPKNRARKADKPDGNTDITTEQTNAGK